ncbi:MAG TPA: pyruvate formate lyase family protein [Spirochaetota bacterium]|nr:pyruvate formate lyase family protein [Spirochaetota bacterium]
MNTIVFVLLKLMAFLFNHRKRLNSYLHHDHGTFDFTVGFASDDGAVNRAISFRGGKAAALKRIPAGADVVLRFRDRRTVMEMLRITPNETLMLILHNKMVLDGDIGCLQIFNFYVSLLMGARHRKMLAKKQKSEMKERRKSYCSPASSDTSAKTRERLEFPRESFGPGVRYLDDPCLNDYSLADFPRLKGMLDRHFTVMPEVCVERPRLITQWFREHGFETDGEGKPWVPELRQAMAFRHLMANRKPLIARDDLVAGTTTAKEPTGVVLYPETHGGLLWGELTSVQDRPLNPYRISSDDIEILHREVFPFWIGRTIKDYVRTNKNSPLCMKIDERWVYYFAWKSVGISHTIPDYPRVLEKGTLGIMADIDRRLADIPADDAGKRAALEAMKITLEGVNLYAANLSAEAARLASAEPDARRRAELERLAEICARVPARPAATLDEAVNAVWILWVALHMENVNTGLSMGRLDLWLQPYFLRDMEKIEGDDERRANIRRALELVGCLLMRGTDHLPLVPDIGNYLFGGSSSDQAITLGGVTPDGGDAVCDMTFIFLKATEMLSIRDPNVNARFHPGVNAEQYLKRLCHVNYLTSATPSMHNDAAVISALSSNGYAQEHIRDWSATGCVEPTISGRHAGHTGSILMNMVSALEMALNNGRHPYMAERLGPETGDPANGGFASFDDFFDAYAAQQRFLIDNAVALNNYYAEAHAALRPTPFLSALTAGSIENARDVTKGGAMYNTSGSSNIGLADVVDSLMAVKKLVYDEGRVSFAELKRAVDADFNGFGALRAMIGKSVPLFGSGSEEALEMARRVMSVVHDAYAGHANFRGGHYTSGFWSMSQHVAYGNLSGTLPSGRLRGKAFTPGLTPHPGASKSFLDNIRDVARLDAKTMDNNIAFNVKLVPKAGESLDDIINAMHAYVKSYFDMGGMQMQFNMVSSATLRDAMAHPENYRNLLVRISGYNAYFTTLNREMQIELIERAEYGV